MRSNVFVGGGCKVVRKVDSSRFAKVTNAKAPVKLSPETMLANIAAKRFAAERLRQSMIQQGLIVAA